MTNEDILRQGIKDFGIEVNDQMISDLKTYREILVDWNQKMNLTGIEEDDEYEL